MIIVRIIKEWDKPDLLRQTSGSSGIWEDIQYTTEPITNCDYVIVLNYSSRTIRISCSEDNIWCVIQEPPNEFFKYRHQANRIYARVFTQEMSLKGARYTLSHPALPWHVDKDYDYLVDCSIPKKNLNLSFITSSKKDFKGHRDRLSFLNKIKGKLEFDLYGYGFNPIKDKWDALAPYKYSLAIENFQGPYYWSEKLADCFLSWTMPIYYGCTNITDYFPKESLIQIDINDPDIAERLRGIINSDLWKKRKDAIAYARDLVLNKYQFFPYMSKQIHDWEKSNKKNHRKKDYITIPNEETFIKKLKFAGKRLIGSVL